MTDFPSIVYVDQQAPSTVTGHRRWLLIGIGNDTWIEYDGGWTFTWRQVCDLGTPVRLAPEPTAAPKAETLKPGDPITLGGSPVPDVNAYVQRRAHAAYLLALLDEDPQFLAELRRRLTESDGS